MMLRVKWWLVISVLVLTIVIGESFLQAEETTEQIMAELETRANAINCYRADLTMTMEAMGKKIVTQGKFIFKKPDKSWMDMDMDMGSLKMKQIYINDGKTLWTYQPELKMVHKINLEKVTAETKEESVGQKANDISKPFRGFQRDSINYVRAEMIGEMKVLVFKGLPRKSEMGEMTFTPAKIEMWIGADDGLVREMTLFNEEGKEMMTHSYTNVEINIEVNDSQFEFTPPEGTQVMDMTEGTINMIKEMKESVK